MINIKGLDKAKVLKALYDASHVQGMGFLQAVPDGTVTVPHCRELLKHGTYFDYLYGRSLRLTSLAMSLTSASMSGTTVAIRRPGPSLF